MKFEVLSNTTPDKLVCLDEIQGVSEERSEAYYRYVEQAPELTTQ